MRLLQTNRIKSLDRNSPIPLYYQLKEILLNRIRNGEVKEGGFLPTEEELCQEFGVSRGTVRKAIEELKEEGYVVSEQGKGVFLVRPKFEQSLLRFYSIGREMQDKRLDFYTKVIVKEITKPTKGIKEALNISEREELNKIVRVRYLENEPVIIENIFIPVKICPNLLEENLEDIPLYDILEDKYKLKILKVRETLEPVVIRKEEAKILGSKVGVPAFLVERITYLIDESPIEVRKSIIRGDRFKFTTELYR